MHKNNLISIWTYERERECECERASDKRDMTERSRSYILIQQRRSGWKQQSCLHCLHLHLHLQTEHVRTYYSRLAATVLYSRSFFYEKKKMESCVSRMTHSIALVQEGYHSTVLYCTTVVSLKKIYVHGILGIQNLIEKKNAHDFSSLCL